MFSANTITFFFIGIFGSIYIFSFFDKRKMYKSAKVAIMLCLISSIYCVTAGIFLISGWQDPLADATVQEIGRASATHGGKGGIIVIAIRYWPYVLIGIGGYFSYYSAQIFRIMKQE